MCTECTPILKELSGPPVIPNITLGVQGNYFDFYGSKKLKRLRTTGLDVSWRNVFWLQAEIFSTFISAEEEDFCLWRCPYS